MFGGTSHRAEAVIHLRDSVEVCRELAWFATRYPIDFGAHHKHVQEAALEHEEREEFLLKLMSGEFEPRPFDLAEPARVYQRLAAEAALKMRGMLLADDVGLGKTLCAIAMLTEPDTRPAVVVTLTHLPRQWARELARFAPGLRVYVAKSASATEMNKRKQTNLFGAVPDVFILNYHKLFGWAEWLAPFVKTVIYDEVQELRRTGAGTNTSIKYESAQMISKAAKYRLGLSATPIYNYGIEFYNVTEQLAPGFLGTKEEFLREWCRGDFGEKARIADPAAFGRYARDSGLMLRRTREDVGRELPDLMKVEHFIDADMARIQAAENRAEELARIILDTNARVRGDVWQASQELSHLVRQATGIAKAPYVADFVRLLVDSGEKVVLYCWHREVYSILAERLKDLGIVFFTGSESQAQKEVAKMSFVHGGARVLCMSLRSGAGLDGLQGSCRMVVFGELDWSPGVHEQAIGRVHRDGQKEKVTAYFLVTDSGSDPVVADALGIKRGQIAGIKDPDRSGIEHLETTGDNIKKLALEVLKRKERV